jgi:hypothetical protein
MMHRLAICLVIASVSLAAPRPAVASATDVYDTVDSVEVNSDDPNASFNVSLVVTGIPAGGSTPITKIYNFGALSTAGNFEQAAHCQRLAVVAMSKPGKFQFAIGAFASSLNHSCKLILRTP